jgi:hypothetical protein
LYSLFLNNGDLWCPTFWLLVEHGSTEFDCLHLCEATILVIDRLTKAITQSHALDKNPSHKPNQTKVIFRHWNTRWLSKITAWSVIHLSAPHLVHMIYQSAYTLQHYSRWDWKKHTSRISNFQHSGEGRTHNTKNCPNTRQQVRPYSGERKDLKRNHH